MKISPNTEIAILLFILVIIIWRWGASIIKSKTVTNEESGFIVGGQYYVPDYVPPYGIVRYTGRACYYRDWFGQRDIGREYINKKGKRKCHAGAIPTRIQRGVTYKVGTIPTFTLPKAQLPRGVPI